MSDHQPKEREDVSTGSACPGCGGCFAFARVITHPYLESSSGCWAAFGVVLAREYGDRGLLDVHRLSVDAYAIQHPGLHSSRQAIQSLGLHLCRLRLELDQGLPAERANQAMLALGRHKQLFTWLDPPTSRGALTVADVLYRAEPSEHRRAARSWARAALDAWSMHQDTVQGWIELAHPTKR